ncbi:type 1 glutamine amidotransferase [Rhizobiaceae bacterium n13]|uniref:Type 1 glutamine amidotransferase n=1 Tax=Ferirhizobium litorale TaxID=2927786 RepID=A0AAE3QKW2_9HYPH|nr:type 1 glutamine amidotransferase [Fererhizobium litorale]MDI7864526.1 type 1 glutamine amidotransferase [Fererhizobium litorale]MDI7924933.1 type 1 glutamine amidotransferase [Fererhizobium litorale]
MRVAVIENTRVSHLGQVGVALAEAGAEIDVFRPWDGESLPDGIADHDAIVVLGGGQSAIDDDKHPYLPELARLMREFGDAGKAVLGICLGSQILARAYGGENSLNAGLEFGWHHVELTEEGGDDPVLQSVSTRFPIFQWHCDTFTLPENAVRLATNETATNQAFRVGRAAYGTQFHFEASTSVVEDWNTTLIHHMHALDPSWMERYPELAARHGNIADETGLAIARAWVARIESAEG